MVPSNLCGSCHQRPVRKGPNSYILCQECRDRSERIMQEEEPMPEHEKLKPCGTRVYVHE